MSLSNEIKTVPPSSRVSLYLLTVGSVFGILLAITALLRIDNPGGLFPASSRPAAMVNDVTISIEKYQQAIDSLMRDKRGSLFADDRAFVLERLIEEELLVQRGVELGLLELNRSIRAAIVQTVIDSVIADAEMNTPGDDELLNFFSRNRGYFSVPSRLRIRRIFFARQGSPNSPKQIKVNAMDAFNAIQGGIDFVQVAEQYGDPVIAPIPDVPLPPAKLREYIGPGLLAVAFELKSGEISRPVEMDDGFHILQLLERQGSNIPEFTTIKDQILTEYKKRRDDKALTDYLEWLKRRADISRPAL
ncbi:MAG: peptidylprolyl isomerase [Gammaproteobacteria bacterium]